MRLADYDCIGFDLDHTLCRYRLDALFPLIYNTLCHYLVDRKGYDPQLLQPFEPKGFMQKGLLLDVKKGNFLKVGRAGTVLRASHGTRPMSRSEVAEVYGADGRWEPVRKFRETMCEGHGKMARQVRSFKDYFDMPAALVAARVVDVLDQRQGGPCPQYDFWKDVLDGLIDMYRSDAFAAHTGGFFPALKEDVARYVFPCGSTVKTWLRELKRDKVVFLVTGSRLDFVTLLAEYCLGSDWKSYFDVVVTYARKPGFFTGQRSFLDARNDDVEVSPEDLEHYGVYSQGNYAELVQLFGGLFKKSDPKVLYVGDNLVQDVFTPAKYSRCHAAAVVEEMEAEGMHKLPDDTHYASEYLASPQWGSFFYDEDPATTGDSTVSGVRRINTLWAEVLLTHSQIAIPKLDTLAALPADFELARFNPADPSNPSGFYPGDPIVLHS